MLGDSRDYEEAAGEELSIVIKKADSGTGFFKSLVPSTHGVCVQSIADSFLRACERER